MDGAPHPAPRPSPPQPSFLRVVIPYAKREPSAATDGCNFNTTTLKLNGFPSLLDFLLFLTSPGLFSFFSASVGGLMEPLLLEPSLPLYSPPPLIQSHPEQIEPDGVYDPITARTHTLLAPHCATNTHAHSVPAVGAGVGE